MSDKLNPLKSLDAIISADIPVDLENGSQFVVKPISISTLAVLDSIGSPILHNDQNMNMMNMMTTLYICLVGYRAAFTTKSILEEALDYFDKSGFTNADFDKLREAVLIQFEKVLNIQPEQSDKKK